MRSLASLLVSLFVLGVCFSTGELQAQHVLPIDSATHEVLYQAKLEFPGKSKDALWDVVRKCVLARHHQGSEASIEYSNTKWWGQTFKEYPSQYWIKQRVNFRADSLPIDIYCWEAYSVIDGVILIQIRDFEFATTRELAQIRSRNSNNWSWGDIARALKPIEGLLKEADNYYFTDVDKRVERMLYEIELLIGRYIANEDYELDQE